MDKAQKEYDAYVEDRFRQKTASILPEEERQVREHNYFNRYKYQYLLTINYQIQMTDFKSNA